MASLMSTTRMSGTSHSCRVAASTIAAGLRRPRTSPAQTWSFWARLSRGCAPRALSCWPARKSPGGGSAPGRTPPAALLSFRARLGGLHERHAHNSFSAQGRAQRAILTMPLPVPAALAGPRQRPRRTRLPTGATPPSASSRRWRKLWTPPTPTCFCWRVPSSDLSARSGCSSSRRGPDGILLVTRLHQVQLFFPRRCMHTLHH